MRTGLVRVLDWDEKAEEQILLQVVIPISVSQLHSSLRDVDAADSKLFGGLTVTAAALGTLITAHDSLNRFWWLAALWFGVAAAFFVYGIWPGEYDLGPDLDVLLKRYGGRPPLIAARQAAGALDVSFKNNLNPRKIHAFRRGLVLLLVGLLGCIPLVLERTA